MEGKLLVISGLSAAGKGTIAKELVDRFDNFVLSVSATTRERRGNEVDGKDYFFVSKEKFKEMIDNGEFLEYAEYVNNYYGTPKKYVEEMIAKGKNVILEIEMQGALQVKKIYDKAVLVFFLPKDAKTQRERLIGRKRETLKQIEERIKQAIVDAQYAIHYDYVLVNENIEDSIKDMQLIVEGKYNKENNARSLNILKEIVKEIKGE